MIYERNNNCILGFMNKSLPFSSFNGSLTKWYYFGKKLYWSFTKKELFWTHTLLIREICVWMCVWNSSINCIVIHLLSRISNSSHSLVIRHVSIEFYVNACHVNCIFVCFYRGINWAGVRFRVYCSFYCLDSPSPLLMELHLPTSPPMRGQR